MNEILVERREQVLWLTLHRPERHNALTRAMCLALARAFAEAEGDRDLRAIVLTGSGQAFCAGGDLQDAAGLFAAEDNPVARLFKALHDCPLPILGRINGDALGGGFGLVCACDLAVGAGTARFGTPEARLGLFPLIILAPMLRVLRRHQVMELALTGLPWDAGRAQREGVLNAVADADDLDAVLDSFLAPLLANAPGALRRGKRALAGLEDMAFDAALDHARRVIAELAGGGEAREGLAAFHEKRPPDWSRHD